MSPNSESDDDRLRDSSKHEEFVLLFSKERRRIYALVYSFVPVAADADDIFQQVSLVLWRRFSEFDPSQDFYRWACGIVYYTVLNFRRTKGRSRVFFSDSLLEVLANDRIEDAGADPERFEALRYCLALLKENDRLLIRNIYEVGSSMKDAAANLGLNINTVYNRMSLIRKKLLGCVERRRSLRMQEGG